MLVVAPNIKIAKAYYDYLKAKGHSARIVTSEVTPAAKRDIRDFKKGLFNILVSVAMASEGVNVPNVSVICFLTNVRSTPWIEQCIARANRIAPGKNKATVYAPADWAFRKAVRMIEAEQLVPLENPEGQRELLPQGERREGCGEEKPWIIPIASTARINETPPPNTIPCVPSEAESILRKNIRGTIKIFLDKQYPGNKQPHQILLYRRMKLICGKKLEDMNHDELVKVWMWVKKEYEK
jgi:superfamily II DNA or RNA helicase